MTPEGQPGHEEYSRAETEAHRLDRHLGELLQELRVIGAGVQVLFAFLLGIAFQARFGSTDNFQKSVYITTLMFSGLSIALLIAPVAIHRWSFRVGIKDEVVSASNRLAIAGLLALLVATIGGILLVSEWVAGPVVGAVCTTLSTITLLGLWVVFPVRVRRDGLRRLREVGALPEGGPVATHPVGRLASPDADST